MINLKKLEVWFITGSQDLYGDETLQKVAENSKTIATYLNEVLIVADLERIILEVFPSLSIHSAQYISGPL